VLGGSARDCFGRESKIRIFIDEILESYILHEIKHCKKQIFLDTESEVWQLDEKIRPDYLIK